MEASTRVEISQGIGRIGDLFKVVQEVFQLPAVRREIFRSEVVPGESTAKTEAGGLHHPKSDGVCV